MGKSNNFVMKVFINLVVVCGGLSNMFLFYKANSAAT